MVLTVMALALALLAVPAKASSIVSQGTSDTYGWAIDDNGTVYVYPIDIMGGGFDADELTCVLYTYGSLQVVYVSGACSNGSISNASAMFEDGTSVSNELASLYGGVYGNIARASIASEPEPAAVTVEDVAESHAPGWAYEDGEYRYYEPDGTLRTNAWASQDGAWYYLGEDGTPVKSAWVTSNGAHYYVGEDGQPLTGSWLKDNGAYYYLVEDGTPAVNAWVSSDGAHYYLGADGKLLTSSWLSYADEWYYLGSDGHMLASEQLYEGGLYYFFAADGTLTTSSTSSATGSLAAVTSACYSTPSTGSGGCAAWVSNVFANAGIGSWHGNACDFYWSWCTSSDLADLKPGMIIAVSSCAGTAASRAYGHVGIYLGNGIVMQNLLGSVGTMSLDTWLDYFDGYSTPAWGWLGGVVLV